MIKEKTVLAVVLGAGVALSACGGTDDKTDADLKAAVKREMNKPIQRNAAEARSASKGFSEQKFEAKTKKNKKQLDVKGGSSGDKFGENPITVRLISNAVRILQCTLELGGQALLSDESPKVKQAVESAKSDLSRCSNDELALLLAMQDLAVPIICNVSSLEEIESLTKPVMEELLKGLMALESQGTQLCPYMHKSKQTMEQ